MANNPVELLEKPLVDLLGLKNDPDMTYEDYFDALKEAAVAAQMNETKYNSEQAESIREELKRIREKFRAEPEIRKKDFKFKIKSVVVNNSKINKDNVSPINTPKLTGKSVKFNTQKFLPKSVDKKTEEEPTERQDEPQRRRPARRANPLIKILNSINNTLNSILNTLKSQSALDVRNTERQRRDRERERRSAQESSMEGLGSGIKAIANIGKKMLAPLESIWDRIVRFFTFVFLGRAFFAFMKWMSDPDNKKKFDIIVNFLSKHWLAIVGAYILFGTSLGGLVRFILKAVVRMTFGMLKIIPKLLMVIAKSKLGRLGLAATALFTAGAIIPKLFPKTVNEQERKISGQPGTDQEKIERLKNQRDNLNFFERHIQGKGSEIDEQIHKLETGETKSYGFSGGGIIPAFNNGGLLGSRMGVPVTGAKGDDTIIAAKRGEAVLTKDDQRDIQKKYGLSIPDYLSGRKPSRINLSNVRPKAGGYFGGGIVQGYAQGGVVGQTNRRPSGPKITPADYHTLMAMVALESDNPQGRADVAQSIYNRLHGATTKDIYFMQNENTLRHIITAGGGRTDGGQYEPSFENKQDWYNIRDLNTAAIAVMNSSKGRKWKWTLQDAIRYIKETETALKDPKLQKSAQSFVGGRPNFYGVSQHDYMKPEEGDVLRDSRSNFFVADPNLPMNVPGPIPEILLPKIQNPNDPRNKNKQLNPLERLSNTVGGIISKIFPRRPQKPTPAPARPLAKSVPGRRPDSVFRRGDPATDEFAGARRNTRPVAKPRRWGIDPRGWFGMKGGGSVEDRRGGGFTNRQINTRRTLGLAGSLINISPIDTMPDRTMSGFRDLAESQYLEKMRNNFGRGGIRGLKGGGEVSKGPTIEDIMMQAHNTTVRIETAAGPEGSGSGVLVRNDKGQYTVLTAGHVLGGTALGEDYVVVTPDGKRHTIKKTESNARGMGGDTDMGTLSFNSKENYAVARPGDPTKVKPGDTTYVGGFPYNPLTSQQDEALRFTKGQSMNYSLSSDEKLKQGYTMAYSNATFPGMSGGFVYNSAGELIGIHGSGGFKGVQEGSRAIPISHYTSGFGSTSDKPVLKTPSSFNIPSGLIKKQENTLTEYNQMDNPYLSDKGSLLNYANSWLLGSDKQIKERMAQPFKQGGFIRQTTGLPIKGGTDDRVLTALTPGEYVLPKATVSAFGGKGFFDTITALTDVNSEPARMGFNPKEISFSDGIKPYDTFGSGKPDFVNLPPINSANSNGVDMSQSLTGSKEVFFSPICQVDHAQSERQRILDTLGVLTN